MPLATTACWVPGPTWEGQLHQADSHTCTPEAGAGGRRHTGPSGLPTTPPRYGWGPEAQSPACLPEGTQEAQQSGV